MCGGYLFASMMFCVLPPMILLRVFPVAIALAAVAPATDAATYSGACAKVGLFAQNREIIALAVPNTGSGCDAASAFMRHARSREEASTPATVRNPFLPAASIPPAMPKSLPSP